VDIQNENSITIVAEMPDAESAKQFGNSPELKAAQERSGVISMNARIMEKV
jgi:uncharacterized protein (DUF1330 family)